MTYQLQLRHVLLPALRHLACRLHRAEQIVRVHAHVHQRIRQHQNRPIAARNEAHAHVADNAHHRMVVHVQKRNVTVLLAQHKEQRVRVVGQLQQHVAKATVDDAHAPHAVVARRTEEFAQHVEVFAQVRGG